MVRLVWGLSSIKPDDGRCQMDCGEEISGVSAALKGYP
jgi:hypothetical protein